MFVFKMRNVVIMFSLCVVLSFGQLTQRARVKHYTEFFTQVIQETIYEIERRGFSSLTLLDMTHNINIPMYRWHVNGTVSYTNGFLISMQKIDVTAMQESVGIPTVDGVPTPRATVRGILNLRDVKLGYDVTFNPSVGQVQKFTGDFTHTLITWDTSIVKNLATQEITVSMTVGTSGGIVRMVYRPSTNITEVLSREFYPYHNGPGITTWSTVIAPIILDVVKNMVPFPKLCFVHC